ncbi:MAG: hypothetical protein ACK502_06720 [Alphaproteobacteria bacterium]
MQTGEAAPSQPPETVGAPLFTALTKDDLLDVGVPEDWIEDVQQSTEDRFFDLTNHIPAEAAEALLNYATTGKLLKPEAIKPDVSPFEHPDAQRRFRVLDNKEELERALDYRRQYGPPCPTGADG